MLGRNHFAESSWHVLTFCHPKFDVQCTDGNYFLNSFDTLLPGFQTQEEPNNWSSTLIKKLFTKIWDLPGMEWDLQEVEGSVPLYEWEGSFLLRREFCQTS